MIIEDIQHIKSAKRDLRNFGFLVGGILAALGIFFLWRGRDTWEWLLGIGGALMITAAVYPLFLKPFQKAWMTLGILLGWVTSHIILIVLFYLVMTPLKFILLLFGKRLLQKNFRGAEPSYWARRDIRERTKESLEKQF